MDVTCVKDAFGRSLWLSFAGQPVTICIRRTTNGAMPLALAVLDGHTVPLEAVAQVVPSLIKPDDFKLVGTSMLGLAELRKDDGEWMITVIQQIERGKAASVAGRRALHHWIAQHLAAPQVGI